MMQSIFSEDNATLSNFETNETLGFIKAITQGLIDIKEGNITDLDEVQRRLGILSIIKNHVSLK